MGSTSVAHLGRPRQINGFDRTPQALCLPEANAMVRIWFADHRITPERAREKLVGVLTRRSRRHRTLLIRRRSSKPLISGNLQQFTQDRGARSQSSSERTESGPQGGMSLSS